MRKVLLIGSLCICANILNAQITVMEDNVQEKVILKPHAFDSLSNLNYQNDYLQYKKYIGYKLYCLPFSNKCSNTPSDYLLHSDSKFVYKTNRDYEITRKSSVIGLSPIPSNTRAKKGNTISTDIYCATYNGSDVFYASQIYTPYDSISNTYFTILNIEVAHSMGVIQGQFSSLDKFDSRQKVSHLRFTLKNQTSGEEIYWIVKNNSRLNNSFMFLVPYFEKMQQSFKGRNVVSTTEYPSTLVDIKTGNEVKIKPGEKWHCYDVTFVNLKDKTLIQPYLLLEKDGVKVMVSFEDFTRESFGKFVTEQYTSRPTFITEHIYDELLADNQRAVEERQRKEEEKKRLEEQAQKERNQRIMQKYGNKYGTMICNGEVCLKMTKEMCRESWGDPIDINTTIVDGMTTEQWVYGLQTYLYFTNGVLTAIQN